jgi:hypothetical protein
MKLQKPNCFYSIKPKPFIVDEALFRKQAGACKNIFDLGI